MARRIGFLAMTVIAITIASAPARGQFFGGMGYGGYGGPFVGAGYSYGYPIGLPYAAFPFPVATGFGNFSTGPGSFNPLFGMGLTPLAVGSFLGETSLRRPQTAQPTPIASQPQRQPTASQQGATSSQPSTTVTLPGRGSRTYTYKIIRQ